MTAPSDAEILETAGFLAGEEIFGLVWLDADLVATKRLGRIVEFVPLGEPVTEGVMALMGFEQKIAALRERWQEPVIVPNLQLDPRDLDGPRFNISVHWLPQARRFIVLVGRVLSRSGVDELLEAQVRLTRIAEAEVATQKKLLEQANIELSRANADLGAFASVISHDLRAPLRALRFFADEAAMALERGDAMEVGALLQRVGHQSRRMGRMLSGLLAYSRIGRKSEVVEEIDTGALAREIAGATERPEKLAITVEGEWPVLCTLVQPLDIVLRNLLDNAVKHHDRGEGRICLRAEAAGTSIAISVEDDGPGIPPEWQEAIFLPFKRIGDDDDPATPEGAGLGLALVKRTVEAAGGSIAVVSAPSERRGTTFRVLWPRAVAV